MSNDMTPAKATALRKPFPAESVGKLPKGGVMLDYVGHAAVTDRLLTVDPEWSWDFALHRADGTPVIDDGSGNLWITLTICGVTRKGVGDGKNAKERIGDAIRNAAMRFGVALDLWAKENLVEFRQMAVTATAEPPPPFEPDDTPVKPVDRGEGVVTDRTRKQMFALFGELKIPDAEQLPGINHILGTRYESRAALTETEAKHVVAVLKKKKEAATVDHLATLQEGAA